MGVPVWELKTRPVSVQGCSAAAAWATAHPGVTGGVLSQDRALEVGEQIFGGLLQ